MHRQNIYYLNEEFEISDQQTAKLINSDYSIIYNKADDCSGGNIIHSGNLNLRIDCFPASVEQFTGDKKIVGGNDFSENPYTYKIIRSDDKKGIAVIKFENFFTDKYNECNQIKASKADCWASLARVMKDYQYCSKIDESKDNYKRDWCLEIVATEKRDKEKCNGINDKKNYCVYVQAVEINDPSLCYSETPIAMKNYQKVALGILKILIIFIILNNNISKILGNAFSNSGNLFKFFYIFIFVPHFF